MIVLLVENRIKSDVYNVLSLVAQIVCSNCASNDIKEIIIFITIPYMVYEAIL